MIIINLEQSKAKQGNETYAHSKREGSVTEELSKQTCSVGTFCLSFFCFLFVRILFSFIIWYIYDIVYVLCHATNIILNIMSNRITLCCVCGCVRVCVFTSNVCIFSAVRWHLRLWAIFFHYVCKTIHSTFISFISTLWIHEKCRKSEESRAVFAYKQRLNVRIHLKNFASFFHSYIHTFWYANRVLQQVNQNK